MAVYRYRLIDASGSDLGPFVSSSVDWEPGSLISLPGGELRVAAVVRPEPETESFRAYLVVEELALRID